MSAALVRQGEKMPYKDTITIAFEKLIEKILFMRRIKEPEEPSAYFAVRLPKSKDENGTIAVITQVKQLFLECFYSFDERSNKLDVHLGEPECNFHISNYVTFNSILASKVALERLGKKHFLHIKHSECQDIWICVDSITLLKLSGDYERFGIDVTYFEGAQCSSHLTTYTIWLNEKGNRDQCFARLLKILDFEEVYKINSVKEEKQYVSAKKESSIINVLQRNL